MTYLEDIVDYLIISGDPNPGSFLGGYTDPSNASEHLSIPDLGFFCCHFIMRHVQYYEEGPDGKRHYECLECPT